eukprot:TRINITY_DN22168_c0_g1_i1.p1 TRINITY_DN22168_c0_g1~~TRINITY_DN22168_c0_g1_i1.p1  ORF type:complete len:491 (+),score=256.65 TRINITY_DN22168_c0_g1_i1:81-1553(+)
MLDVLLFRKEDGANLLRESQRRRCKPPEFVDKVIDLDVQLRAAQVKAQTLKKVAGYCSKMYGERRKKKIPDGENAPIPDEMKAKVEALTKEDLEVLTGAQLMSFSKEINQMSVHEVAEEERLEKERDAAIKLVGNIVHESLEADDNEDNNRVVRTWAGPTGAIPETTEDTWNHVDLMELLGGMDTGNAATNTAGGRAYFLKGDLVRLQFALVNYALNFLVQKQYQPMYPPFFMNKEAMGKVAELASFDEELYHVSGEGSDKYLIATSEQPICAYHAGKWFQENELKPDEPIRYAGYSTCFRKEAGSHGRDTLGIFRVHQFEKIEQFIVCQPRNGESWKLLEEMISTSEDFYKSLGLPYKVIEIVAGAINLAAAKKYDLEAYFPASKTYRELVSVSNCTDYQARAINCRFGPNMKGTAKENVKEFAHMLNGTLCAITRTMCCICENHQTAEGVVVPEVLRPYMGGLEMLKFTGPKVRPPPPAKGGKKKADK